MGHLHVLKWAVANGCSWQPSECLCKGEVRQRYPEVLVWIREHSTEGVIEEPEEP